MGVVDVQEYDYDLEFEIEADPVLTEQLETVAFADSYHGGGEVIVDP
jgi:hypothetical protein